MSRIYYDDEGDPLSYGRWERNRRVVFKSRNGQRALREIEAALVALWPQELAADTFYDEWFKDEDHDYGGHEVCVLGAVAAYKGFDDQSLPSWLQGWESEDTSDWEQAEWCARNLGMTHTLAWLLMEKNDEDFAHMTPHERYVAMLAFVRSELRPAPSQPPRAEGEQG